MPSPTTEDPHAAERPETLGEGTPAPTLASVLNELRHQGERSRRTQQGFAFFAVLALVLAGVNLIVIAAKLNGKSNTTTVTRVVAPAPGASGAAASGAGTSSGATAGSSGTAGGAASGAASAGATSTTPALAHKVGVQLAEYTVKPTASAAAAGKVTFDVRNSGHVTHEFVVLRTNRPAADLLKGDRADESGNVGETGDLQPGQSKSVTLKLPPGHYALICNLPGHYKAGQHVDFTVR